MIWQFCVCGCGCGFVVEKLKELKHLTIFNDWRVECGVLA